MTRRLLFRKGVLMPEITVEIQKLVNGGQGLGFCEGTPAFAWNALPGETVSIKLTKKKKDFLEGVALRIQDPSPARIDPLEEHFMSCAPWQIMTFEHENHWKQEIAKETFRRVGGIEMPDFTITHDQDLFGYRNKMEYAFRADESTKAIRLAFHKRGSQELYPIDKCLLAKANINKAAQSVLDMLNRKKTSIGDLKSLVLRENNKGEVIASLFVRGEKFRLAMADICDDPITGFHVYVSEPRGHSTPVKPLHSQGNHFLTEELAGKIFRCAPLSFFQVNTSVFEKTLNRLGTLIGQDEELVDLYSGVGAIGISLANKSESCVLVEIDAEASSLARENIEINGLTNCTARTGSSENMLREITKNKTIIFDPPRAGLHPKVISRVVEVLPNKIIYLSCDVATQARDIKMLGAKYRVEFCELYNFFPRTPHIESLVVLEKD